MLPLNVFSLPIFELLFFLDDSLWRFQLPISPRKRLVQALCGRIPIHLLRNLISSLLQFLQLYTIDLFSILNDGHEIEPNLTI